MKKGFTLVELSIVLVIIGMLTGGVLVGQMMIRNVRINKVISEKQQFDILVNLFYEEYKYMPGDFPGGYASFGSSCGNNVTIDHVGANGGCNGNGNGQVDYAHPSESYLVWSQLAGGGYLQGKYYPGWVSGIGMVPGNNAPKAPFNNSGWFFTSGSKDNYVIRISGQQPGGDQPYSGVMSPTDALAIDKKIDDGIADKGIVTSPWNGANSTGPDNCLATAAIYGDHDRGTTCFLNIANTMPY